MRLKPVIIQVFMACWLLFTSIGVFNPPVAWTDNASDSISIQGDDPADDESGLSLDACCRWRFGRKLVLLHPTVATRRPLPRILPSSINPQTATAVRACRWQFVQRASAPARAPTV